MNNISFKEVFTPNLSWEQEAETLASEGTPFVLVSFSYSCHSDFYNQLSIKFGLESRIVLEEGRAYFWKKE